MILLDVPFHIQVIIQANHMIARVLAVVISFVFFS
jgi:hypothetical protein